MTNYYYFFPSSDHVSVNVSCEDVYKLGFGEGDETWNNRTVMSCFLAHSCVVLAEENQCGFSRREMIFAQL